MAVGADAARAAIEEARAGASAAAGGAAIDESLVAASIRRAVESLADITGAAIGSDLIERIFSRHCIGK
jgi:tRNA U34 5-carboxymethylaminomethyl modifying GTPase MnmE/TrmE